MQESNDDIMLKDFDDENAMFEMPDLRRQTTKFNEANANRISTGPLMRQFSKDIKVNYTPPVSTTTPSKGVNVLMIGTGEYTTGYVDNLNSESDKGTGVVALTMFDLRKSGKTDRLALCGVNGSKFPKIREHMKRCISNHYSDIDISVETYPADDVVNPHSYIDALDQFKRGDAVIIFTPDNTHFDIALAAVLRGMHVLVTKPLVKTLEQHKLLHNAALENDVLVVTEVHKVTTYPTPYFNMRIHCIHILIPICLVIYIDTQRFDPIYQDARDKAKQLGPFSYLYSYMSQPKYQLETFKAWAGDSSGQHSAI